MTGYSEDSWRLAALVTSYGVGTRSYNQSAEKRELDRQRAAATARYLVGPRPDILLPVFCRCRQRTYPHVLGVHKLIRSECSAHKFTWPWSLCLSEREELSTERERAQ